MGLTVNGENLPGKPLQLKFGADSNYISAFQTMYAGANKIFENQGNGITRVMNMKTVIRCLCLNSLLTFALVIMYNRLRTEMCQLNVDLEHRWKQL
jgi:hypothetical protein